MSGSLQASFSDIKQPWIPRMNLSQKQMENDGHTRWSTDCCTLAIVPAPALTHMITHT